MPIYPFLCPEHGEREIFGDYSQSSEAKCPVCRKAMQRRYTAVKHIVDFTPGFQPAFGRWIDTKRELANLVAEKGLRRG